MYDKSENVVDLNNNNGGICHQNPDDNRRPQHYASPIMDLLPIDLNIVDKPLLCSICGISLSALMRKNNDNMNLGLDYFYAQIILVIVPIKINGKTTTCVYGNHTSNSKYYNQVHYSCLLFLRVVSGSYGSKV